MILLTMSLDIALGYAGIVTLGQAAFFGFGAYTARHFRDPRRCKIRCSVFWSRPR